MAECVIFCAGEFEGLAAPIAPDAYIIAADGGYDHVKKLGITPSCVLGDFDSLGYTPEDAAVFPVEKDDTDAMLAVRHGLKMGCERFFFYGALDGPRLDHTVANYQTLQFLADHGVRGWLIGRNHVVTVLKNGQIPFPETATGILSVFCMGPAAKGVTLKGLQYPLENGTLEPGFPLGVSNHFVGKKALVRVEDGSLLIFYDRENGICG
ncbi:MAG: thiamine diphosphokinase [Oscillospiraceae bacterium]|nr:thiamine diphosphokinase [Oscillospiraceae bacterium]